MKILSFVIASTFLLTFSGQANAATIPTFPSCLNPQGTIKSTFDNGTHGIVGSSNSYSGSDTVYRVLDNSVTQCFCGGDGQGIQTDWWQYEGLTDQEIQNFKNDGWFVVPNGLAWGLADKPYLAKNSNYSCNTSRVGGESSSKSEGSVLGLATTGNGIFVTLSGFLAVFSLFASRFLKRRGK